MAGHLHLAHIGMQTQQFHQFEVLPQVQLFHFLKLLLTIVQAAADNLKISKLHLAQVVQARGILLLVRQLLHTSLHQMQFGVCGHRLIAQSIQLHQVGPFLSLHAQVIRLFIAFCHFFSQRGQPCHRQGDTQPDAAVGHIGLADLLHLRRDGGILPQAGKLSHSSAAGIAQAGLIQLRIQQEPDFVQFLQTHGIGPLAESGRKLLPFSRVLLQIHRTG